MKFFPIKFGLRSRILAVVILAATLRALVMIDYLQEQQLRDIAEAKSRLSVQAGSLASMITLKVEAARQFLDALNQSEQLQSEDRASCSAFLAGMLKRVPQYTGLLTITPGGELFCDSLQTGRQLNVSDRFYFRQATLSDRVAVEPAIGRLTGLGVLQVALASRSNGNLHHVTLASINLDQLATSELARARLQNAMVLMLDSSINIVAAAGGSATALEGSVGSLVGKSLAGSPLARHAFGAKSDANIDVADPLGVKRVWAVAPVTGDVKTGMTILIGVPADMLVAPAEQRTREVMIGILGATLFVVLLAWFMAEWVIRRPIIRIIESTSRFRGGDLNARIGGPYPGGEIGDLIKALDHSSDVAQQQHQEISRLNAGLEERVQLRTSELQAANEELKAFAYSIAHDLRQPLISLNGYAQLLRKQLGQDLPADAQHCLERMNAGVRQISELADAMVALAHLSRTALLREPVDLSQLVMTEVKTRQAREPSRRVELSVAPNVTAVADRDLIRLALMSLIDNAWKFSANMPIVRIAFGVEQLEGQEPVYHIRDAGAGFDMAFADKLFTAFHRLHSPAEFAGTGIGLAQVHKIIGRHGGRIWAESSPGEGATFFFTLGQPAA